MLLGVLKGAAVFLADLVREVPGPVDLAFVRARSYGDRTESSGQVRVDWAGPEDLERRTVVVVDTILDTGHTLAYLNRILAAHEPASVRRCVLLNKAARREADVAVEHVGFEIDDVWVAGYGMDHENRWRGLPYIGSVDGQARR